MSELIQKQDKNTDIRWKLLTGASALALTSYIASVGVSLAGDADRPTVWIELGAGLDALSGTDERFDAPFLHITPTPDPYKDGAPFEEEKPSRFSIGGEINLSIQPKDSNWVFSGGIRYGRSHKRHDAHHQTTITHRYPAPFYQYYQEYYPSYYYPAYRTKTARNAKFADTTVKQSESHLVVDFRAGRDVGLGVFGRDGRSVISGGIRLARFSSHNDVNIRARPNNTFISQNAGGYIFPYAGSKFSSYYLAGSASRSFRGIGPSLSWTASTPIVGEADKGELSLDWGINGAVLFGRQKAEVSHQGAGYYYSRPQIFGGQNFSTLYKSAPPARNRARNVIVPNLGGNIGVTYRLGDAKISLGYRADFFFGAMDRGIDTAKETTLGFNGPYASISIGLGG